MIWKILLFVLVTAPYGKASEGPVTCSRDFRKIGCFVRDLRLVPHLLITDLDPTHKNFGTNVDWADYGASLHSLACRCRDKAFGHYKYFGIGMFGECVGGNDNAALDKLLQNPIGSQYSCVNGNNENCNVDDDKECSGTVDHDFFYEVGKGDKDCTTETNNGDVRLLDDKATIKKNTKVATIPELGMLYDISFEVYPTGFPKGGYTSILHMTISGNINKYGSRIPGIWFRPTKGSSKTNRILVCNAMSGNRNFGINSPPVPLNKWTKIRVSQQHEDFKYVYRIYVEGSQIYQRINNQPRKFHNVSVYVGDPWYLPQKGYIRNLHILQKCQTKSSEQPNKLAVPAESVLAKNNLLGTIPAICKEYSVSFDVNATTFATGWHSILHLSQGGDHSLYGDRTPGVWFHPSRSSAATNRLHICAPISRNKNWCYNSQQFPKNKWISVKIKQTKVGVQYWYSIDIDGKQVRKVKNTYPLVFYGVNVYAAEPWRNPQAGSIRNININGGDCNKG